MINLGLLCHMDMKSAFSRKIDQHKILVLDGGLATELENKGFDLSSSLWSAQLLLNKPQVIVDVHLAYLKAGADIITTASYQGSFPGFMAMGLTEKEVKQVLINSVRLAQSARDYYLAGQTDSPTPLVAASIGPYGAYLADGSEYRGEYDVSDAQLIEFHQRRLHILDSSGADILACETIPGLQEARVLMSLLAQCKTPSWLSFSCLDEAHLCDGSSLKQAALLFADHPRVLALGINCTAPRYVSGLICEIKKTAGDKAIIVYPNSGENYNASSHSWCADADLDEFAQYACKWRELGATIIGGCCRIGPQQISRLAQVLKC